jgi:BsuBI/PstI restriction endonuclease domain
VSDSASKTVYENSPLETALGIRLNAAKVLPDVILANVAKTGVRFVFVEVVASDGPVDQHRKGQLLQLLADSPRGYKPSDAAFVTAYKHRQHKGWGKTYRSLAWGSFAWLMMEPEHLLQMHDTPTAAKRLSGLV